MDKTLTQKNLNLVRWFGEEEKMDSPLGFCLGIENQLLVTDTGNNRVVIFDITTAKVCLRFGSYGTGNGYFVKPRKVTMVPQLVQSVVLDNPIYIVCDRGTARSRLQVFTPNGKFIRVIPIPTVDIVSGLTGTQDRKIILSDSIRGDIIVLNEFGEQLFFFNSIGVEEPGDVAVHNNHYYVCDFRGHAIGVFNQYGDLVRKIGTEHSGGFLNYPNGIDISNDGEILVGDSHGNQFNLNIFKSDTGKLISSFRCPNLKVSGCVGLKCTQDGWLVTLSKKFSSVLIMDTVLIRVDD